MARLKRSISRDTGAACVKGIQVIESGNCACMPAGKADFLNYIA